MDQAKVKGIVHVIEETKSYGQRGFQKRLVVIEQDDGRFTSYIPLEFVQANVDLVESLNVGDEVEITYRLGGRKWQRDDRSEVKYFLSAEALGLKVVAGGTGASSGSSGSKTGGHGSSDSDYEPPGDDDPIPF